MPHVRVIAVAALSLGLAAHDIAAADPLQLRGEINRGETLVHQFEHGDRRYEFRLVPTGGGWTIWIGDPMQREENYVAAVTPPFRGINPAIIEGWHFRNRDNTGPNEPGDGNVNAPQSERRFAFVVDRAGYQAAQEALAVLLWPDGRSDADIRDAETRLAAVPRFEGVLLIEALELGNLVAGEHAHVERMAFRVTLKLP